MLEVDTARRRIALSMKSNPQKRIKTAGDARNSPRAGNRQSGGFQRRESTPFGNSFGDAFSKLGR